RQAFDHHLRHRAALDNAGDVGSWLKLRGIGWRLRENRAGGQREGQRDERSDHARAPPRVETTAISTYMTQVCVVVRRVPSLCVPSLQAAPFPSCACCLLLSSACVLRIPRQSVIPIAPIALGAALGAFTPSRP